MSSSASILRPILCLGLSAVCIMLSSGCSTLGDRTPKWLNHPQSVYPEDRYLVAVGSGDTRRAAENAAAGNLARIFEARIQSDERLRDESRETLEMFTRTTDFTTDTRISSTETLYNVRHAETWRTKDGRCYAVAYLERSKTAALYREKIEQHAERVHYLIQQADTPANQPVRHFALLRAALKTAKENEVLRRQLAIIHPSTARAINLPYSLNKLGRSTAEAAGSIRFSIALDGKQADDVQPMLEKLVTDYGFTTGTPPVLRIKGDVRISDTGQRNAGLLFVRFELNAKIIDTDGRQLIALQKKGREGHETLQQAEIRALRTLEQAVHREGRQLLNAYFDRLAAANPED